jgi:S1-C subfamily serine protease
MRPALRPHTTRFAALARHVLLMNIEGRRAVDDAIASGVLLTDRLAVTASHVARRARLLTAYGTDFDQFIPYLCSHERGAVARTVWQDEAHDLAIVQLSRKLGAVPARYASSPTLSIGQAVLRLGYDGYRLGAGYIHGFETHSGVERFMASIAADLGASGGPLFDFNSGELVGIVTHICDEDDRPSATHGTPLRTLFTLLAQHAPDLHRKIIARAVR